MLPLKPLGYLSFFPCCGQPKCCVSATPLQLLMLIVPSQGCLCPPAAELLPFVPRCWALPVPCTVRAA